MHAHASGNITTAHHVQMCIARAVPRSELLQNQKAIDALELEWVKLETAKWSSDGSQNMDRTGVWDLESVMEYDDAVKAANLAGEVWHFVRLHELCFAKKLFQ